jgi:hypothetical protein
VGIEKDKEGAYRSGGGSTSSIPPSSGWEWRWNEKWESFRDISVVQGEGEPCAQITLMRNINESNRYSGTYTRVHEQWKNGRQVFPLLVLNTPLFLFSPHHPLSPLPSVTSGL